VEATLMRRLAVVLALVAAPPALGCESQAQALFSCGTSDVEQSSIALCSDGDAFLDPVRSAQLTYMTSGRVVLAAPPDPAMAPHSFAFAHSNGSEGYLVTLQFKEGDDTYYLYSLAIPPSGEEGDMGGAEAGLGRLLPDGGVERVVTCAERPFIYISSLRETFLCDDAVLGPAACSEHGAERIAPLPMRPAAPIPAAP
jgi:hypothetical protein